MSLQERLARVNQGISNHRVVPRPSVRSDLDGLKQKFHRQLIEEMGPELEKHQQDPELLNLKVQQKLQELLAAETTPLSLADKNNIVADITDDVLGYGPIEPYLKDPEVTEVMVNNADTIYIERFGKIYPTDARFLDESLRR